jgi:hypothetical protein
MRSFAAAGVEGQATAAVVERTRYRRADATRPVELRELIKQAEF